MWDGVSAMEKNEGGHGYRTWSRVLLAICFSHQGLAMPLVFEKNPEGGKGV